MVAGPSSRPIHPQPRCLPQQGANGQLGVQAGDLRALEHRAFGRADEVQGEEAGREQGGEGEREAGVLSRGSADLLLRRKIDSGSEAGSRVSSDRAIPGHDCQALTKRLGDQHPVEGIAVNCRKLADCVRVFGRHR